MLAILNQSFQIVSVSQKPWRHMKCNFTAVLNDLKLTLPSELVNPGQEQEEPFQQ